MKILNVGQSVRQVSVTSSGWRTSGGALALIALFGRSREGACLGRFSWAIRRSKSVDRAMSAVDEVFETWEELEESGAFDRKLEALQLSALEELEEVETPSLTANQDSNTRMIILGDDALRTQYVPPKPTVKILKRPARHSQGSGDGPLCNGDNKPKQPIKSLKQREQEYAEARKRILGEEQSPEERQLSEVNKIQPKPSSIGAGNLPDNVVRLPAGPDGTRGFNVRR